VIRAVWTPFPKGMERTVCDVGSLSLVGVSRSGSGHALARELVRRGIADDEMAVFSETGVELYRFPSFRRAARYTINEGERGEKLKKFESSPYANKE